jgi:hypothetical protein
MGITLLLLLLPYERTLRNEILEDVYLHADVNRAYSSFLIKYLKYFVNIFPLKKSQIIMVTNQHDLQKG